MLRLIRYKEDMRESWNRFLCSAVNCHFFFNREYFDHQKNRFRDHSLFIYKQDTIIGLLAGVEITSESGVKQWHSHAGLSFGGLIQSPSVNMETTLAIFSSLRQYLLKEGFLTVKYKAMPHIYYSRVSLEDRCALFVNGAKQWFTQPYSVIFPGTYYGLSSRQKTRIRSLKRNASFCVEDISTEKDLQVFYNDLCSNLQNKYGVKPVHTLNELKQLKALFPNNILFKGLKKNHTILAGTVLFINRDVIHTQYLYNSPQGHKFDSLMILLDELIKTYNCDHYISLGTSSEDNGRILNSGLIRFKEKFGARALTQDFYDWNLKESNN